MTDRTTELIDRSIEEMAYRDQKITELEARIKVLDADAEAADGLIADWYASVYELSHYLLAVLGPMFPGQRSDIFTRYPAMGEWWEKTQREQAEKIQSAELMSAMAKLSPEEIAVLKEHFRTKIVKSET